MSTTSPIEDPKDITVPKDDSKVRKQRAHWTSTSELQLLRQTVKYNPFVAPYGTATALWDTIANSISVTNGTDGNGCRNKVIKLMEKSSKESQHALVDSGVTYNEDGKLNEKHEDIRLIEDIKEQIRIADEEKKEQVAAEVAKEAKQEELRVAATLKLKDKPKSTKRECSSDPLSDIKRSKGQADVNPILTMIAEGNKTLFELIKVQTDTEVQRATSEKDNATARLLEAKNNAKLMDVLAQLIPKNTTGN